MWIALCQRETGVRASDLLNIKGDARRLGFDLTCTLRLLRFDNERRADDFKSLGIILGGESDGDEQTEDDFPEEENLKKIQRFMEARSGEG